MMVMEDQAMGNEHTTRHEQIPAVMDDDARWQAVLVRERRCDGRFVFAVRSTGIYCRPSCPARRLDRFKDQLREGDAVTGALYDAGYRSSSQLYTQAPARLGMTPTTYRKGGKGMDIMYTTTASPLGSLLVAATERGLCTVRLGDSAADLEQTLR